MRARCTAQRAESARSRSWKWALESYLHAAGGAPHVPAPLRSMGGRYRIIIYHRRSLVNQDCHITPASNAIRIACVARRTRAVPPPARADDSLPTAASSSYCVRRAQVSRFVRACDRKPPLPAAPPFAPNTWFGSGLPRSSAGSRRCTRVLARGVPSSPHARHAPAWPSPRAPGVQDVGCENMRVPHGEA